jgi:hypothetical protein
MSAMAIVLVFGLLACGLCPGLASAAQLEAGQANTGADLSPQASTKAVYVITSSVETATFGSNVYKNTLKYTYNDNGLVKKLALSGNMDIDSSSTTTYSYSGTTLKKAIETTSDETIVTKYTTNKKGQFTKAIQVKDRSNGGKLTNTYTVKYKSGKLKKINVKGVFVQDGESSTTKNAYSYAYKNGRVVSRTADGYESTYEYDKKGNLNKITGATRTNKYNSKNQVTKTTLSAPAAGYKYTKTFKYKAIKVDASAVDKVLAQQWAIVNANMNFAFGVEGV